MIELTNPDEDIKAFHVELVAPPEFWKLTQEERAKFCNGCGPGNWKVDIIPDKLFELPIHTCCDIHDYMYSIGTSEDDKTQADKIFLNNMLRMIDGIPNQNFLFKKARKDEAYLFYEAVHKFGGPAFWSGKHQPEQIKTVEHNYDEELIARLSIGI